MGGCWPGCRRGRGQAAPAGLAAAALPFWVLQFGLHRATQPGHLARVHDANSACRIRTAAELEQTIEEQDSQLDEHKGSVARLTGVCLGGDVLLGGLITCQSCSGLVCMHLLGIHQLTCACMLPGWLPLLLSYCSGAG